MTGIAPAVQKAVVESYYPEALKEAENTRSRAQNGYTIAAAVAAAIVAGGLFGDVDSEQSYVQITGLLALALWLAAAVCFISAVAGKVALPGSASAGDADAFVIAALDRVREEKAGVERRLTAALWSTYAAVVATVVALGLALATDPPSDAVDGTLVLTKPGSVAVGEICGGQPTTISAHADPATFGQAFSKVTLNDCGGKSVDARLAKAEVAGFASSSD